MTANELADGLDKIWDNECRSPIVSKSADMLRQQQAEIEVLKSELDRAVELYTDKAIEIEALKKEKWLTEIDAKQQALKQIIDWMVIEHDSLACSSYPILKKASEK